MAEKMISSDFKQRKSHKFLNKIPSYILTAICLAGFLYQTTSLAIDYISGYTVVSIRVEKLQSQTLPAFTLCFPEYLSVDRTARKKDFSQLYSDYMKRLNQFKTKHGDYVGIDSNTSVILEEIYKQMKRKIRQMSISAHDILFDLSIPIASIGVSTFGFINGTQMHLDMMLEPKFRRSIIESLRKDYVKANMKCFTYFSHLSKWSRDFKIESGEIIVYVYFNYTWFPNFKDKKPRFYIHSPNSLPDPNYYSLPEIDPRYSYRFDFNQLTTELLGQGYDTNCHNYDLDHKFANFNMRSDCLMSCIQRMISKECNLTELSNHYYMLRKQLLEQKSYFKKGFSRDDDCQGNNVEKIITECQKKCKSDCIFHYYSMETFNEGLSSYEDTQQFTFTIRHNSKPDFYIKYLPQTTFLSLVCNFGGLLGMWLGLSFIKIIETVLSKIYRMFKNRLIVISNVNLKNQFFYQRQPRQFSMPRRKRTYFQNKI